MGSARYDLLDQDAATSSTSVSADGRAAWWSTHTCAVRSQQHDDADRLAAAAEEVEADP
jgi:hypothetical protein